MISFFVWKIVPRPSRISRIIRPNTGPRWLIICRSIACSTSGGSGVGPGISRVVRVMMLPLVVRVARSALDARVSPKRKVLPPCGGESITAVSVQFQATAPGTQQRSRAPSGCAPTRRACPEQRDRRSPSPDASPSCIRMIPFTGSRRQRDGADRGALAPDSQRALRATPGMAGGCDSSFDAWRSCSRSACSARCPSVRPTPTARRSPTCPIRLRRTFRASTTRGRSSADTLTRASGVTDSSGGGPTATQNPRHRSMSRAPWRRTAAVSTPPD